MSMEVLSTGDIGSGNNDGGNPVKVGFQARTTLPGSVTSGQRVNSISDKFGRQIFLPYTIRDLTSTGYLTLTRLSEGSIISGVSSTFLDVKEISCINTTGQVIRVDIRFGTAGAVIDSLTVPANDMRVKQYNVPLPMHEAAQAVTAQIASPTGDISDNLAIVSVVAVQNQ